MEISPLVAHAVFLLERGQTNRRPDKQTKSQIHLDALNPPVWTNIVHRQNCCHHQSAERQRYHSKEATRTVRSRGEADANTPAHQILKQPVDIKSGHRPNAHWRRPPGRPRNSWLQQINNGSLTCIRQSRRAAEDRAGRRSGPPLPMHYDDVNYNRPTILPARILPEFVAR